MKFVKSFEEYQVSEEFKYHLENGIGISDSIFRIGSTSYTKLFEETKKYWDENNIILNGIEAWMVKNLEVGKKAKFKDRKAGKTLDVILDSPERGGNKKFYVYHNSGREDEEGNVLAMRIEWGDKNLTIKNDDPKAAASFWARQQCDLQKKMDPSKAGFWACYSPTLFGKQLGLSSNNPW